MPPTPVMPRPPVFRDRTRETLEIRFRVITPVFGGGVVVNADENSRHIKAPDNVTPIREAGIRGAVRQWWRATSYDRFRSLAEMRAREAVVFGSVDGPGLIRADVDASGIGLQQLEIFNITPKGHWRAIHNRAGLAYGGFALSPAQHATTGAGTLTCLAGEATLRIRLRSLECLDEITRALKAWIAFGGIGGRTTRGFGSILPVAGGNQMDMRWFTAFNDLDSLVSPEPRPQWAPFAVLGPATEFVGHDDSHHDAVEAHNHALLRLRDFRQKPGIGRNPGQAANVPGRSRWPEADFIRATIGPAATQHSARTTNVNAVPRAAFGLPIVFHFKTPGDPQDRIAAPLGKERCLSPLRLRTFRDTYGRYFAGAVTLDHPAIGRVELRRANGANPRPAPGIVTLAQATTIQPLNLSGTAEPDVLSAFLDFFPS